MSSAGKAGDRVMIADPHAMAAPVEAEVTRVRRLTGVWRWLLISATGVTIFLSINQQFTLRFFIGYTQLNTEYFYLLILCMLPFTFLIFPATSPLRSIAFPGTTPPVRRDDRSSAYLMMNVRAAADSAGSFPARRCRSWPPGSPCG